jgi:hypothetical protein
MIDYLQPSEGPVVLGSEAQEVVYAKNQPEYNPLRTLVSHDTQRAVLSRWTPSVEQREAIAEGKDIYLQLWTFGHPLQPILMFIADDGDAADVKDVLWPMLWPTTHSTGTAKEEAGNG